MTAFFSRRLSSYSRNLKKRFAKTGVILMYHRIAQVNSDPQLLAVTASHFEQHLEVILKFYRPTSLTQLSEGVARRKVPPRSVVITFDDGYSDNLYAAKPLLEKQGIPATVFITGSYIGKTNLLWWDELEKLFLLPGELPRTLQLDVAGKSYHWDLGESSQYSEKTFRASSRWSVLETSDFTPRHAAYRALCLIFRALSTKKKQEVLVYLRSWAGKTIQDGQQLVLSAEEIITLANGGLVEIGSHTMTHPALSSLPEDSQEMEIMNSKAALEGILGIPVKSFAYPFGSKRAYTKRTVGIVRNCGFACACSNYRDLVWRYSNLFELPRFIVRDWDGDFFKQQLTEWFDE